MIGAACLLMLPSAVVAVFASLRRTYIWVLMFSFSLASAAAFFIESFYIVFVMERFDEKFRHAPDVAFELSLFGGAIIVLFGLLLFGGSLALSKRKAVHSIPLGVTVSAILGGLYVTTLSFIDAYARSTPVAFLRAWVVLFPIISARLTLLTVRRAAAAATGLIL